MTIRVQAGKEWKHIIFNYKKETKFGWPSGSLTRSFNQVLRVWSPLYACNNQLTSDKFLNEAQIYVELVIDLSNREYLGKSKKLQKGNMKIINKNIGELR